MLALQRTIGNRAVTRLVKEQVQRKQAGSVARTASTNSLQRSANADFQNAVKRTEWVTAVQALASDEFSDDDIQAQLQALDHNTVMALLDAAQANNLARVADPARQIIADLNAAQAQTPATSTPTPTASPTATNTAQVGKSGMFPENTPTKAISRWNYVVYQDHVRIGNKVIPGDGNVIGGWPWLTNNPGDLTGDVNPRLQNKNNPAAGYWQDKRVWGDARYSGATPDALSPISNDTGMSAGNAAIPGVAARGDLAIFADAGRGSGALKEWIQKYYGNVTLAESIKLHLGPTSTQVKGVDDPEKYPKIMQQYMSDMGYAANYVATTLGSAIKDTEWNDVIKAYGVAEGYYKEIAGARGQGKTGGDLYAENKGVIYRCTGRDAIDVYLPYRALPLVTALPTDTPPEIQALLGCATPAASP